MVDHRKTPGQRAYRLPGWFFLVTGALSLVAFAFAGWVLVADPFGGPSTEASATARPSPGPSTSASPTPSKSWTPSPAKSSSAPNDTDSGDAKAGQRQGIKVVILNATRKPGLAAQVAKTAEKAGWTVADIGNWPYPAAQNAVFYPDGHQDEADLLGEDLSIASVRPVRPGMSVDQLTVILLTEP